jgi:VCBS repeat-containing protein
VTVSLTVTAANDVPVAVGEAYGATEDVALAVPALTGVLANDTDVDGNPLTAILVSGVSNGTLTLNANGSFNYVGNANYSGTDSFTYKVNDGTVDGNTVTVNLTVNAANDAPVANDDLATAGEDNVLTVNAASGLLANDTDVDAGSTLSLSAVNDAAGNVGSQITLASGALLTVNADGSYSYDPNGQFEALRPGQTDTDSFTYTTTDGSLTDTATVTITIDGANEVPVAGDDSFNMTGNTPITLTAAQLLGNDTDPDAPASALTITGVSAGTNGTVVPNGDGTFTFTPATGFSGAATFTYTVADADGGTDSGTVTLNVTDPVWYVNNAIGSDVTGDGSYARPFATMAPLSTGGSADVLDNANDTIFVYNAGTYSSGIVLEAGQKLFGDGHAFSVNGIAIGANGSNTTIGHSGIGVTLSTDNTVMGVTLNGTANGAVGVEDGGVNVGTFVMDESSITGSGKAVDIDNGGTLAVDLDQMSSASSTSEGIHLQGTTGSFNAATGIIQTSTGSGVLIGASGGATASSGGDVNFTYGGDISSPGGSIVEIQDRTGGTVTFSGTITEGAINAGQTGILVDGSAGTVNFNGQTFVSAGAGTGNGVTLTNNSGTINFAATGTGLDITTTSGSGLTFTGGGTLNITGAANSVVTGTGQILNLQNGAVGTSGIAFQTLTSGTVATGNAININNLDAAGAGTFSGGTVTIGGTTGAPSDGINISGGSNATFVFASATIDNTGGDGIELNGNNGAVTFTTVNLDGMGGNGVSIIAASSAVNINGGSIGATNDPGIDGLFIDRGSAAINIAASVTKTGLGGYVVDIRDHGTGAINLSGAISATGVAGGVLLNDNASGNINFTGDVTLSTGTTGGFNFWNTRSTGANVTLSEGSLDIDTTSGAGISATSTAVGAGSLTISGANNSIASTTGRAISIDGVTSNLTLHDVTVSGGGTTTGVFLKNTGASGQFVVTGDGSVAGSGGTIKDIGGANLVDARAAATTGTGIYLENVSNVSLSNMNFGSTVAGDNLMTNFGIRGTNVNNFTLKDSVFLGNFGDTMVNGLEALNEGAIRFGSQGADGTGNGLTGTGSFLGNTIGGGFTDNLAIFNNNTGSLNMTVADSANDQAVFNHNNTLNGNDAILIETRGTGGGMAAGFNLTLLVSGVEFKGARGDNIQTVAASNTNQTVFIQNNSFINTHPDVVPGGGGVALSGGGNTSAYSVNYAITNNTFKGAEGTALAVNYSGQNVSASGIIVNNIIGTPNGVFDGTQALGGSTNGGNGISVTSEKYVGTGSLTHAVRIEGNTVADINNGIAGISITGSNQGSGTSIIEATIRNNTVRDSGADLFSAFYAALGGAGAGDTTRMGLNISNNTTMMAGQGSGMNAFYLDQVSQNARFYFPGYSGSANGEFVTPSGTASSGLGAYLDNTLANNGTNGPFATFPGIVDAGSVFGVSGSNLVLAVPLLAASAPATPWETVQAEAGAPAAILSAAELATLAEAAIARWADAGATEQQLSSMRAVEFDIEDLNGMRLAESSDGHVVVDDDAAGHGWYVDQTPHDDSEFNAGADGIGAHHDLLTVLMHELGHQIGLEDSFASGDEGTLMFGMLESGVRIVPDPLVDAASLETPSTHSMGWREAELPDLDNGGGSVSELLSALDLAGDSFDASSFAPEALDLSFAVDPSVGANPMIPYAIGIDDRVL